MFGFGKKLNFTPSECNLIESAVGSARTRTISNINQYMNASDNKFALDQFERDRKLVAELDALMDKLYKARIRNVMKKGYGL